MAILDGTRPAAFVADLGFLLRRDVPTEERDALLVVALREAPTARHFDPQTAEFWVTSSTGHGERRCLTHASRPGSGSFSWGTIELTDRFGVANTFVTFGGTWTLERETDGATLTFRSRCPIFRRGGHSQRYDAVAAAVSGFFARLRAAVDEVPGFEQRLSDAEPAERYAAFLLHDEARLAATPLVRERYGVDGWLVRVEAERLRARQPAAWAAGRRLLADACVAAAVSAP